MSSDLTASGIADAKQRPSVLFRHLRSGEKVLWSGKPVKLAFLFSTAGGLFGLLVVLFLSVLWGSIGAMVGRVLSIVDLRFVMIMLIFLGSPIWQLMRYRNTEYMTTDQRLITQTGAIGLDTRFVDLDRVQEVYVKVGLIDKVFRTGSVFFESAAFLPVDAAVQRYPWLSAFVWPSLEAPREPYEVQKTLRGAIEGYLEVKAELLGILKA